MDLVDEIRGITCISRSSRFSDHSKGNRSACRCLSEMVSTIRLTLWWYTVFATATGVQMFGADKQQQEPCEKITEGEDSDHESSDIVRDKPTVDIVATRIRRRRGRLKRSRTKYQNIDSIRSIVSTLFERAMSYRV